MATWRDFQDALEGDMLDTRVRPTQKAIDAKNALSVHENKRIASFVNLFIWEQLKATGGLPECMNTTRSSRELLMQIPSNSPWIWALGLQSKGFFGL